MYTLLRPLWFSLDAELAHTLALSLLPLLPTQRLTNTTAVTALGLTFNHPIGLAAGLDKNADYLDGLAKLGFSFIEVGTVTPKPQTGNPKPRLFRLPKAHAIINRMGFNNKGVDALCANISKARYRGILGINIGKNKETSLEAAASDYSYCLQKVYSHASYVTVNISSPNTPGLRELQQEEYFAHLLDELLEVRKGLADKHQRLVPLVIKISPDESDEVLKRMAELIVNKGIEGIIATNTTCARAGVDELPHAQETGGLSGKPLAARATDCIALIHQVVGDAVTIIGTGGIDDLASAREKQQAGATLLQVYTGLIYQGPGLVKALASL